MTSHHESHERLLKALLVLRPIHESHFPGNVGHPRTEVDMADTRHCLWKFQGLMIRNTISTRFGQQWRCRTLRA